MKIIKLSAAILLLSLSSACVPNWYKPMGYVLFRQMPKDGTPGFRLGWLHGCQSGLGSQFGGAIYMYYYTWSRDPDITMSNPNIEKIRKKYKKELKDVNWNDPADVKRNFSDYNTIFWNAHSFCRHSVLGIGQMAGMGDPSGGGPPLPGQDRFILGHHSVSNVWRIHSRGDTRIGTGGMW